MADRQWYGEGMQVHEEGEEEYFVEGVQLVEDQAAVVDIPYYYYAQEQAAAL